MGKSVKISETTYSTLKDMSETSGVPITKIIDILVRRHSDEFLSKSYIENLVSQIVKNLLDKEKEKSE